MSGFHYFFRGLKLLGAPDIRPFVVLPILINVAIFIGLSWLVVDQVGTFTAWLTATLGDWLAWLLWLVWLVVAVLWLVIYGYSFSMISNTLAAPFYGLLAERVQARVSGQVVDQPLTVKSFLAMLRRTLVREVQKLLYVMPRLLGLVLVSIPLYFIPVVGLLVPVLWFAWGAWSLALENIDYAADNNLMDFGEMKTQLRRRRVQSLSFGSAVVIASSIPLFNLIAIPAAVAGGTALWVEHWQSGAGAVAGGTPANTHP
jgi:CysZ protein